MMLMTLLKKDLLLEMKGKQFLLILLPLSLLLSTIVAVGIHGSFLESSTVHRIFPALVWIVFFFATTASVSRSVEYEFRFRAIDSLLLSPASPHSLFLAKVCANSLVATIGLLFSVSILSVLLDIAILPALPIFLVVGLLVSFGYAALSTLLSTLTIRSRVSEILLFLVLLPLLFPLFFAAHELTLSSFLDGKPLQEGPWLYLLGILDLVYLAAGSFLFAPAIRG